MRLKSVSVSLGRGGVGVKIKPDIQEQTELAAWPTLAEALLTKELLEKHMGLGWSQQEPLHGDSVLGLSSRLGRQERRNKHTPESARKMPQERPSETSGRLDRVIYPFKWCS